MTGCSPGEEVGFLAGPARPARSRGWTWAASGSGDQTLDGARLRPGSNHQDTPASAD